MTTSPAPDVRTSCGCYRCLDALDKSDPLPSTGQWWTELRTDRFIVCGICGNKRCPRAADHRNICSGSNAPGQKGSLYE